MVIVDRLFLVGNGVIFFGCFDNNLFLDEGFMNWDVIILFEVCYLI